MDLDQLNKQTSYKELRHAQELVVNQKYKLVKLRISKTKYGDSILAETEDFVCYLPRRFHFYFKKEGIEPFNDSLKNRTVYLVSKGAIGKTTDIFFME